METKLRNKIKTNRPLELHHDHRHVIFSFLDMNLVISGDLSRILGVGE
jgi:hypothetical protein